MSSRPIKAIEKLREAPSEKLFDDNRKLKTSLWNLRRLLKEQYRKLTDDNDKLQEQLQLSRKQVRSLKDALSFYADASNYILKRKGKSTLVSNVESDLGARARRQIAECGDLK